jgi:response regulator RpfG family c-di-GMP phosphodiesterase
MLEGYGRNIKSIDSIIRYFIAAILAMYSIYTQNYYLLLASAVIFITANKKFCFSYYLLGINKKYSTKNYYMSFLPRHNPSAVFIFDIDDKIIFKNTSAESDLKKIDSPNDINIKNYKEYIKNDKSSDIQLKYDSKHYQVRVIGISKEKILLVYFTDVTKIYELNDEIEHTQREVIYAMGEIGETRSKETGNHVKRVAKYSYELAKLYGLSEEDANKLKVASPMHDIGKVGIPDAILNAPRKLTDDEFVIMKTHAQLGYNMLKNSTKPILQAASIVANEHHEKYDGSGYPNAKSKKDIHIYGRITAVADVFDALASHRVYKKAWPLDEVLDYFKEQSGKHFEPKLVELFLNNLEIFLDIKEKYKDVK